MLVFIVPLRSPKTARNWQQVSRMAIRTLRSACAQDCDDFRVVLVCNEKPAGMFDHPRLLVIEEDFPLPGPEAEDKMRDKWSKVQRGLIEVRGEAPAHFMCVDADDCVHRGLARHCRRHPESAGFYFETGYLHDAGSRWLFRWPDFNIYCGTSSIVWCGAEDLPATMDDPESCCPMLEYGHVGIVRGMEQRGRPLHPLPFVGAIYNTDTGENHTDISVTRWKSRRVQLARLLRGRLVTRQKRADFGLYVL